MSRCGTLDDRGFSCVDEAGHTGDHWFQIDADICDLQDENGYVCTLRPGHDGSHRYQQDATPRGSVARVFRLDDDPAELRQRELDALNPPPDPSMPDNSDLEGFAEVLPPQDQVALWAGRILRKEAQIESMLQTIHYQLSVRSNAQAKVPQLFGSLLTAVKKLLESSQIDDETYVADCLAALDRLGAAHHVRNRVVHDQWVIQQEAPGEYVAVMAPKGVTGPGSRTEVKRDLTEFRECYEELRFCSVMIAGIFWSIGSFVGNRREIWRDMVPSNREAISGRFTLIGENHWELTDLALAARINEEMRLQADEFRARMPDYSPEAVQADEL